MVFINLFYPQTENLVIINMYNAMTVSQWTNVKPILCKNKHENHMSQICRANCAGAAVTFMTTSKWSILIHHESNTITSVQHVPEANPCLFVLCTSSNL